MRKTILALTAVDLLLMVGLAFALTRRQASSLVSPANPPGETATAQAGPQPVSKPIAAKKFDWSDILNRDLHKYVANLRSVSCPEETIKEMMITEVNRIYAPREAALKVRADDIAPWEKATTRDRRTAETKLRQLLEEKRNLLKELTGVDIGVDMPTRLAGRGLEKFETAFANIPEAKRDQVRGIQEDYWSRSDDIKQRTMGYLEPEDRQEFMRIKAERRDALAKVLSPQELQDYEIKTSDTGPALKTRLAGSDVTDEEFRKIFDYMQPLDEQYSLGRRNPDPTDKEFTAARAQAEKDLQDQIHSVLGDDRYAEFQRSKDPVYKSINQAGADAGVPKEAILQAYDAQKSLQQETQKIFQDQSLTPEQRGQSLQGLYVQAQQTLQQIFGDKTPQIIKRLPQGRMAERYGLPAMTPAITVTPQPAPVTPVDHP